MMAHNSVNGEPCHSSASLMQWLRQQGKGLFSKAFMASDMCDVGLLRQFRVVGDLEGSVALAMGNGLDQEYCNPTDSRGQAFPFAPKAIASGLLAQSALDRSTANILRAKFAVGLFDERQWANSSNLALLDIPAHRAVARQAAIEGTVLLKNSAHLLPLQLSKTHKTNIAIL